MLQRVQEGQQQGVDQHGHQIPHDPVGRRHTDRHRRMIEHQRPEQTVERLKHQIGHGKPGHKLFGAEPGKIPAEEQERRHMKGVDDLQQPEADCPVELLQGMPQHHKKNQQQPEIVQLIRPVFPRFQGQRLPSPGYRYRIP